MATTTVTTAIHKDPEILAGEPVFVGTRVPLKNLFDYLEAGDSLEVFLDAFPVKMSRGRLGRVHQIAGQVDLALPLLRATAGECAGLWDPVFHTRLHAWLGEALEWLAQRVTEWTVGSWAFGVALATILVWG